MVILLSIIAGCAAAFVVDACGMVDQQSNLGQVVAIEVPFAIAIIVSFALGAKAGAYLSRAWVWLVWTLACVPATWLMIGFSRHGPQTFFPLLPDEWLMLILPTCSGASSVISGKAFKHSRDYRLLLVPGGWIVAAGIALGCFAAYAK